MTDLCKSGCVWHDACAVQTVLTSVKLSAGCLQSELHQLSAANTALAAENMQMKHEMELTVSLQKELALSKQVHFPTFCAQHMSG